MIRLLVLKRGNGHLLVRSEDGTVTELSFEEPGSGLRVGDIVLGKVLRQSPNLDAAYVETAPGQNAFLPLKPGTKLKPETQLAVQVVREAAGSKLPGVSASLSLAGRYLVLTEEKSGLHLSHRLSRDASQTAQEALGGVLDRFGVILRTGSRDVPPGTILREAEELERELESIRRREKTAPLYTLLRAAAPEFLALLTDTDLRTVDEILTDDPEAFAAMRDVLAGEEGGEENKLRLCGSQPIPPSVLYGVDKALDEALSRRVWLKSGGYLVIDRTEAMTVIDVNTGKNEEKGRTEKHMTAVNIEAAEEIARQLRLRNLSGIILVDFINMREEEDRKAVEERLREAARRDPVSVKIEGFTRLGLMEMTRRRVRKPLSEQLRGAE